MALDEVRMPWTKGTSGTPSGRPRGAAGVARFAAELTRDGHEVLEFLVGVMRDSTAGMRERTQAALAVLDRVAGKPLAPSELAVTVDRAEGSGLPSDWQDMTLDERRAWIDGIAVRQVRA